MDNPEGRRPAIPTKRRAKGSGGIRELGPGRFELLFREGGKQRSRTVRVKNRTEASKELAKLLASADEEKAQYSEGYPFSDFALKWLGQVKGTIRVTTYLEYERIVKQHFIPALGDDLLHKITVSLINEYRRAKLDGDEDMPVIGNARKQLAPKTVNNHLTLLHRVMDAARKDGLITANPVVDAEKAKVQKQEVTPLTQDEIEALLKHAPSDQCRMILLTLIQTGIRVGECLALSKVDLDFDKATISIKRTMTKTINRTLDVGPPKTASGIRTIKVSKKFMDRLHDYLDTFEGPNPKGLVFPNQAGEYIHIDNWRKRCFAKAVKDAEIMSGPNIHTLRHTHVSLAIAKNVHPKVLSRRIGHSDVGFTLNRYGHLYEQHQEDSDVVDL